MRLAGDADIQRLFEWRNDPVTVQYSGSRRPVTYAEHLEWFGSSRRSGATRVWIGELAGEPVGQVRVDRLNGEYKVGIAVASEWRNRGFGKELLAHLMKELRTFSDSGEAIAEIDNDNRASHRLFVEAGFAAIAVDAVLTRYRYSW